MASKIMDLSELEEVLPSPCGDSSRGCQCEGSEVSRLQDHLVSPTFRKEQIPLDETSGRMLINLIQLTVI